MKESVRIVVETGKSIAQVARDLTAFGLELAQTMGSSTIQTAPHGTFSCIASSSQTSLLLDK